MQKKDLPLIAVATIVAALMITSSTAGQSWLPVVSQTEVDHVANVPFSGGAGLLVYGDHAYSGAQFGGLYITDISDPENPVPVAHVDRPARDVAIQEVDGRVIAAVGSNTRWMDIIDVTDPTGPWVIDRVSLGGILHNVESLEGTGLFYNSRSGSHGIDIVDVNDPDNPHVAKVWNGGFSCHDIEADPEADRAYCAGLWATYILDIGDPLNPTVLGQVTHPDISLHHWALATPDHDIMILGDEDFGFHSAGCGGGTHTPAGSIGGTDGAIWFYDITDPSDPQLLSSVTPPNPGNGAWCTAHFGQIIPDLPLLAVGWYSGGIVIIDWSLPELPRVVEQWQTSNVNAWDVQYQDGYLFTGDLNRGMDVLQFDAQLLGLPDL